MANVFSVVVIFGPASIALKNGTIASGILPPVRFSNNRSMNQYASEIYAVVIVLFWCEGVIDNYACFLEQREIDTLREVL